MSPEPQNHLTHALPLTTALCRWSPWRSLSHAVGRHLPPDRLGHPFLPNSHGMASVHFLIPRQCPPLFAVAAVLTLCSSSHCIPVDENHCPTRHLIRIHCFIA